MPPTFDSHVWECARLWISRYGSQAREEALKRAREFDENGGNGMPWRRVAEAIGCLDGAPPATATAIEREPIAELGSSPSQNQA
jgi:hypothetical protein